MLTSRDTTPHPRIIAARGVASAHGNSQLPPQGGSPSCQPGTSRFPPRHYSLAQRIAMNGGTITRDPRIMPERRDRAASADTSRRRVQQVFGLGQKMVDLMEKLPPCAFSDTNGQRNKIYFIQNKDHLTYADRRILGLAISRYRWMVDEEDIDFDLPSHRVRRLKFLSVGLRTFSTYSSHWRRMKESGFGIDMAGLEALIAERGGEVIKTTSLKSWVDAVKFHMISSGNTISTAVEEANIKRLLDGLYMVYPNISSKPVGDIGYEQICSMMLESSVPSDVCEGFALMHATGCRGSEVCNMGHLMFHPVMSPDEKTVMFYEYTQGRTKVKVKNRTDENRVETHYTDPCWNDLIAELIGRAMERFDQADSLSPHQEEFGMLMVPGFKATGENKWIKVAAEELGWETSLDWRVHSLRYGAAVAAALDAAERGASAQGVLDAIKRRTAHLSPEMALKYSEVREDKVARGRALERIRSCVAGCSDKGTPFAVKYENFIRFGKKNVVTRK